MMTFLLVSGIVPLPPGILQGKSEPSAKRGELLGFRAGAGVFMIMWALATEVSANSAVKAFFILNELFVTEVDRDRLEMIFEPAKIFVEYERIDLSSKSISLGSWLEVFFFGFVFCLVTCDVASKFPKP